MRSDVSSPGVASCAVERASTVESVVKPPVKVAPPNAYNTPPVTPTPNAYRSVGMAGPVLHEFVAGSYTSTVFSVSDVAPPITYSRPPSAPTPGTKRVLGIEGFTLQLSVAGS